MTGADEDRMAATRRKVHITGGRGFLGRGVQAALAADYDVSASDVDDMDVTNRASIEARLGAIRPDVVVHLAGLMGAPQSKRTPETFHGVNAFGSLHLLAAMRALGLGNLVFLSSLTVHGMSASAADRKTEDSPFAPEHPYATSKVLAEYMIRDYTRHAGLRAVILRPSIVTGNTRGEPNAVVEFCRVAACGGAITLFGDGLHAREFVSQRDVGAAVARAAGYLLSPPAGASACEPFIISTGRPVAMAALARRCIELAGGGRIEFAPKQVQAFSLASDVRRARTALGWEAQDDTDALIRETLARLREEAA
jgi:UDP-glucose 4-epimerase